LKSLGVPDFIILDTQNWKTITSFSKEWSWSSPLFICLTPDGSKLISSDSLVYDVKSGLLEKQLNGFGGTPILILSNNRYVLSNNGINVIIWDIENWNKIQTIDEEGLAVISNHGDILITTTGSSLKIWELNPKFANDIDDDKTYDIMDPDNDNDGYDDFIEEMLETDPMDQNSTPADMDQDYLPDEIDFDIDGDGHYNNDDAFPDNPDKWKEKERESIPNFGLNTLLLVIVIFIIFIKIKKTNY
jgi:serine/threonine protein kinase